MPTGLPATPWLNPPDVAGQWAQGYGLGQRAAIAQAEAIASQRRLDQQSQALAIEAQQKQQALEVQERMNHEKMLMDQQKLEITKSYHQQQIALGQQKIQEAAAMNKLKAVEAARKSAVYMQAQKEIEGGADPTEVWAKYGPVLYGAGGSGYVRANVERQKLANMEPPAVSARRKMDFQELGMLKKSIVAAEKELPEITEKGIRSEKEFNLNNLRRRANLLQQQLLELNGPGGSAVPASAPAAVAAPAASTVAPHRVPVAERWVRDPEGGFRRDSAPPVANAFPGAAAAPAASPANFAEAFPPSAPNAVSGSPMFGTAQTSPGTDLSQAVPKQSEDSIINAWRRGEISKSEAYKRGVTVTLMGPEWVTSEEPKDTWHLQMKKNPDTGEYTHTYPDYPDEEK